MPSRVVPDNAYITQIYVRYCRTKLESVRLTSIYLLAHNIDSSHTRHRPLFFSFSISWDSLMGPVVLITTYLTESFYRYENVTQLGPLRTFFIVTFWHPWIGRRSPCYSSSQTVLQHKSLRTSQLEAWWGLRDGMHQEESRMFRAFCLLLSLARTTNGQTTKYALNVKASVMKWRKVVVVRPTAVQVLWYLGKGLMISRCWCLPLTIYSMSKPGGIGANCGFDFKKYLLRKWGWRATDFAIIPVF